MKPTWELKNAKMCWLLVVVSHAQLSSLSDHQALTSRSLNSMACPFLSRVLYTPLLRIWPMLMLPDASWVQRIWGGVWKRSPTFLCDVLHRSVWLWRWHSWCSLASIWIQTSAAIHGPWARAMHVHHGLVVWLMTLSTMVLLVMMVVWGWGCPSSVKVIHSMTTLLASVHPAPHFASTTKDITAFGILTLSNNALLWVDMGLIWCENWSHHAYKFPMCDVFKLV